ncbi:hypothetical protein M3223_04105 [Paenibacillus pasadenensis]|uniref:hypothetical protein n=1 Tax=Paenibacillus pasadenensis TaxID=217090 RepID=UPI00203FAAA6|nr:hypothetical protein [Paenibacillus pasadenensis]MCM3746532.1 hypothetical protein [Paenibacillus pasadenensis]
MARIVRIKTPQDSVIEAIEFLLERAKDGEVTDFIFASHCPDGTVATSWANADFGQRCELIGHAQADVMYAMVEANIDKLIEYV